MAERIDGIWKTVSPLRSNLRSEFGSGALVFRLEAAAGHEGE
jgi:hypothetical protein